MNRIVTETSINSEICIVQLLWSDSLYTSVFLRQWMPVNLNKLWCTLPTSDSTTAHHLSLPCKRVVHYILASKDVITKPLFLYFGQFWNVLVITSFLKRALLCSWKDSSKHASQKSSYVPLSWDLGFSAQERGGLWCIASQFRLAWSPLHGLTRLLSVVLLPHDDRRAASMNIVKSVLQQFHWELTMCCYCFVIFDGRAFPWGMASTRDIQTAGTSIHS